MFAPRRSSKTKYVAYQGEGDAVVEGQAFLKTAGGDIKPCAGNNVVLNPVTTYSTEWFEHAVVKGEAMTSADDRVKTYARKTKGDGQGNFVFEKIPAGSYYVTCLIEWKVPTVIYNGFFYSTILSTTGGQAYAKVTLAPGQHAKIVVSR